MDKHYEVPVSQMTAVIRLPL